MKELNNNTNVITLGQLKQFLNETCKELSDDTPIMLNTTIEDEPIVPCIQVLADEESIEFYNY